MWYNSDPRYAGSVTGMVGVARAGNIGYTNANKNIIRRPTHHTGKLLLTTAKEEVILSIFEPILFADIAPKNIPIIDTMIVAVVKRRMVLGNFSSIISFTSEEPVSEVKNFACPKSSVRILYMASPSREGVYQG